MAKPTPSDIRKAYNAAESGHFFDRDTMRFFGDTMRSFRTIAHNGETYLYRKPSAMVNVFGSWKRCGRDFFNVWKWDAETSALRGSVSDETVDAIYAIVRKLA